jgi:hypothetical protein
MNFYGSTYKIDTPNKSDKKNMYLYLETDKIINKIK